MCVCVCVCVCVCECVCVCLCDGEVRGKIKAFWVWSGVGVAKCCVRIPTPCVYICCNNICREREIERERVRVVGVH